MSTLEQLQDLLVGGYKVTREQLPPEAQLNSLGIDSLGLIEMMFLIEDRFGIVLPDDHTTNFETISDVVNLIDGLLAAKSGAQAAASAPAAG